MKELLYLVPVWTELMNYQCQRSTLPGTCRAKIKNKTIDTGDVVKSEALTLTKHRSGFSTFK